MSSTLAKNIYYTQIKRFSVKYDVKAGELMLKVNFLKNLVTQLCDVFPAHAESIKRDFEKNCHRVLTKAFNKFDLVTREEFDTQTKVLLRTRKKLEEIEKHMQELQDLLKHKHQK